MTEDESPEERTRNVRNPYARFQSEDLTLRDHLATDRTVLANERTFLSYARTALALFIGGVSLIRFFDSLALVIIGAALLPVAIAVFLVGLWRFLTVRESIRRED